MKKDGTQSNRAKLSLKRAGETKKKRAKNERGLEYNPSRAKKKRYFYIDTRKRPIPHTSCMYRSQRMDIQHTKLSLIQNTLSWIATTLHTPSNKHDTLLTEIARAQEHAFFSRSTFQNSKVHNTLSCTSYGPTETERHGTRSLEGLTFPWQRSRGS